MSNTAQTVKTNNVLNVIRASSIGKLQGTVLAPLVKLLIKALDIRGTKLFDANNAALVLLMTMRKSYNCTWKGHRIEMLQTYVVHIELYHF